MADSNETVIIKGRTYTLKETYFTAQKTVTGKNSSAGGGDSTWSSEKGTQCLINAYVEGAAYPYGVATSSMINAGYTTDYVYFTDEIFPGGVAKYCNGSAWVDCEVYYCNGSAWKPCEVYYCNGSAWKDVTT